MLLWIFLALLPVGFERMQTLRAATSNVVISFTVTGASPQLNVIAIPEKRIPTSGNDSTHLTVEVRAQGSTTPIDSQTITTDANGVYHGLRLSNLTEGGTYDLTAKGYSHLRVLRANVVVMTGATVDFTAGGTAPLPSGDVNSTAGDNKVNGIDLSLIVGGLLGSDERLDLNQDTRVNGIDLTNAVVNLNRTGDS